MPVLEKHCCAGVAVSRGAGSVTNASKWRHVFDLSYRRSSIVMCALCPKLVHIYLNCNIDLAALFATDRQF